MSELFKVPIRNLFILLSYAENMPELTNSLNDVDEDIITYDFICKQFLKEVELVNRRGLVKDYVAKSEPTNRLAGRVIMEESMPYIIAKKPVVVCEKDEYTSNIWLNQLIKSTLRSITLNRHVKQETKSRSFKYMELMPEVDMPSLTKASFAKTYFGRHNMHYKWILQIARLLHEMTLLSHKNGNWSLFSAEIDERALNSIFEKFLFNFYRLEQQDYQVKAEGMQWKLEGDKTYLPGMRTDVSLIHRKKPEKIIIDAKFYKNIFQVHHGKSSFHSHNMYQLFTYLMHQSPVLDLRGILIYPFNGVHVNEKFKWNQRVKVEIVTIDLEQTWKEIYESLIKVINKEKLEIN
ncbi:McrC family protein [Planococcus sp. YIM B11945]|uniref:McrC family protein n=1 Tax=Planococcus sp. YIM B11945 TaxID=3435410 RepID=UPI003D7C82BA